MTDEHLENVLRETFGARDATVTRGPDWDGAGEHRVIGPRHRRTVHWLAPLTAAVVVLGVVGVTFALRGGTQPTSVPGALHQLPIPEGMKAVDAFGVEIFVPIDMPVDAGPCGPGVFRPVPPPTMAPACAPLLKPIVRIWPSATLADEPLRCIGDALSLGDESACVSMLPTAGVPPGLEVTWPQHAVTLSTINLNQQAALKILRTAHAVPVDGTAAPRETPALPPRRSPHRASSMPNCCLPQPKASACAGTSATDLPPRPCWTSSTRGR